MKNNLSEIRWGIIGVGDVCEVKSGPALQLAENSRLVAVMRRNKEKVKDFASRHQVPRWYTDADTLLSDPEVNAVYIATPPNSHKEYVLKAAAAGKPVYVEKPMAMNYRECREMIDACEKAGVPLRVAYYRRSLPNFVKIKQLVESGAIGEVRLVSIELYKSISQDHDCTSEDNWRIDPDVAGGGYFFDLACHQLDLLDFYFGPIKEATGFSANQAGVYRAEDIVSGSFIFESGVVGTGIWCFSTGPVSSKEVTTIIGSKGQIRFDYFGPMEVTLEIDGQPAEALTFDIPKHIQQPLIQTVVNDFLGTGTCPSTGISGSRTNLVMEKLYGKNF